MTLEHRFLLNRSFHERKDRMNKEDYIQKIIDLLKDGRTENELIFILEFLERIFKA